MADAFWKNVGDIKERLSLKCKACFCLLIYAIGKQMYQCVKRKCRHFVWKNHCISTFSNSVR